MIRWDFTQRILSKDLATLRRLFSISILDTRMKEINGHALVLSGLGMNVVAHAANKAMGDELHALRTKLRAVDKTFKQVHKLSDTAAKAERRRDEQVRQKYAVDSLEAMRIVLQSRMRTLQSKIAPVNEVIEILDDSEDENLKEHSALELRKEKPIVSVVERDPIDQFAKDHTENGFDGKVITADAPLASSRPFDPPRHCVSSRVAPKPCRGIGENRIIDVSRSCPTLSLSLPSSPTDDSAPWPGIRTGSGLPNILTEVVATHTVAPGAITCTKIPESFPYPSSTQTPGRKIPGKVCVDSIFVVEDPVSLPFMLTVGPMISTDGKIQDWDSMDGGASLERLVHSCLSLTQAFQSETSPSLVSLEAAAKEASKLVGLVEMLYMNAVTPIFTGNLEQVTNEIITELSRLLHEFQPATLELVRVIRVVQEPMRAARQPGMCSLYRKCFLVPSMIKTVMIGIIPRRFIRFDLPTEGLVRLVWLALTFLAGDELLLSTINEWLEGLRQTLCPGYILTHLDDEVWGDARFPLSVQLLILAMITRRVAGSNKKMIRYLVSRLISFTQRFGRSERYIKSLIKVAHNDKAEPFDFAKELRKIRQVLPWYYELSQKIGGVDLSSTRASEPLVVQEARV